MKKISNKVSDFEVNLDDYDSAEKLESLGLDHLKHALEGFFQIFIRKFLFFEISYSNVIGITLKYYLSNISQFFYSVRGLKCGGSLTERAVRLYSVKNLKPEQYPKNICARGKKK